MPEASLNIGKKNQIVHLLYLGMKCCELDPETRPSMRVAKQVIMELQENNIRFADDSSNIAPSPNLESPSLLPSVASLEGPLLSSRSVVDSLNGGRNFSISKNRNMIVSRKRFLSSKLPH